jgi:hypothetical protein
MKAKPLTFARRCVDVISWIAPGTILALISKCPMCLAAYIALWTGIGLSFSAAIYVRASLVVLCAGLLYFSPREAFFAWFTNFASVKQQPRGTQYVKR